jgi:glucosylceramidase
MKYRILFLIGGLTAALFSCQAAPGENEDTPPAPPAESAKAQVYTTSVAGARMEPSQITLGKPEDVNFYKVTLNGERYQSVDGFGLAVTQASCYNLLLMSEADRRAFLEEVFSREKGIGSSLIRVCIGGSDFSLDEFTWCDTPGMEHFAVHPLDQEYLFPILDEIYRINPDVKIIASPWSCPRWMKMAESGGSYDAWTGGRLNPEYYDDYAQYFVKWIQAMENRGYRISSVTLQNEPLHRGNSMSLYMPWQDQRDFLNVVGPAFKKAGIQAGILVYDHNYDVTDYALNLLKDESLSPYIQGSAWHNYLGQVNALDKIHTGAPDKDIYFTEASIGNWNYEFNRCLLSDFRDIFLGTLSRYGKGVTLWNLMLDSEHKPFRPGGCDTCWGGVTISAKDHSLKGITRNSHYYDIAQCSKVLQPGAVRLGTSGYTTLGLTYLWFRNPDGSQAVLLLNENSEPQLVNLVADGVSVPCKVPAKAIQSVLWK